ncbi:MAG: Fic family protein [bacterium]
MLFELEKPALSKIDKNKTIDKYNKNIDLVLDFNKKIYLSEYLYWDKLKYKTLPPNFSAEEMWFLIKLFRKIQSEKTVIKSENEKYFTLSKLADLNKFLHEIDLNTGGNLFLGTEKIKDTDKQKMISRGVMEEAIASSQLEGAHTTRKAAKKFLREAKKPKNESEQMILNNYKTMLGIESEYKNRQLDKTMLLELHEMITKKTIPENKIGKFRTDDDKIVVANEQGVVYHNPPSEKFVAKEISRLFDFANDELEEPFFIHPIIKAILLHFWVGYLHPFVDGNGRIARALFYWYLLKKGYWGFAYLPISTVIKKSPAQYGMSFVYSEQDDLDLTYFVDYNIRKIKMAAGEFNEYLINATKENKKMNKMAHAEYDLNERQIQLLQYLYGDTGNGTSLKTHMNIYKVSKKTAIKDLKTLESFGFIAAEKIGRNIHYYATDKINELFK